MKNATADPAANQALPPRANPVLTGHEAAESTLRRLSEAGRLPHALLLSGPRGIGKATLAFRLARFMLHPNSLSRTVEATGEDAGAISLAAYDLAIPTDSGTFRRVAAGGHADLLTIERAYDPRRRRLRSEIVVDDTREIADFLHLTPAEGGWRVVVVDGADEMNRSAANSLLKILEEPPRNTLLLLITHSPGRLLPTIRSRCRHMPLSPLPSATVRALLARYRPDLAGNEAETVVSLSSGSIGRALELAAAGGVALYAAILDLLGQNGGIDAAALHGFADRLARTEAEDAYRAAEGLIGQLLGRLADAAARGAEIAASGEGRVMRRFSAAPAAHWAALREDIAGRFARADALNLDRKQTILGAFFAIDAATRQRSSSRPD